MKRLLSFLCALLLTLLPALASAAPVQIGGESPFPPYAELMEIRFLDMFAASDAFLLRCGGESMLIDSGHEPFFKHLTMHMDNLGIKHIDYFLNTHVHEDHISGFAHLILRDFEPDMMYLSTPLDARYEPQLRLMDKLEKYSVPNRIIRDGETLTVGGASVLVMRAQGDFGTNGRSTCNVIAFGDARALLMADATGQAQVELMKRYGDAMRADILKMAHHGYNRAEKGLFELVRPQLAVLTNAICKDVEDAIRQVKKYNVPLLSTPRGNIVAQTDGSQWYVYQEKRVLPN